jgi:thiamine-phosphate pyrophosphorylase
MSEDAPRLYLITPLIAEAAGFVATFEGALDASDIACVFLRVEMDDPHDATRIVRQLAPLAQRRGVACLVGDPQLAARGDADGVHIEGFGARLDAALATMKPARIVGVGGLMGRDDAMRAGEAGVDYLMFGGSDDQLSFAQIRERIAWWAEIFNLVCVAHAQRLDEVGELARAGADFVALSAAVWNDPCGAAAAVAEAARALAGAREPAA